MKKFQSTNVALFAAMTIAFGNPVMSAPEPPEPLVAKTEPKTDDACSCNIRKQHQVKKRLERKKKLEQE
ncbi:MAG: hypothetical protein AAF402_16090 [Pseudomonadota bacterium]